MNSDVGPSQEAGLPYAEGLPWRTKGDTPPASFSPVYPRADVRWSGTALWSVGVSCPGCVPSQGLAHPVPLGGEMSERALVLCEHHSAVATAPVCYQHPASSQQKTQHHEGCYRGKPIPAQPDPVQMCNMDSFFYLPLLFLPQPHLFYISVSICILLTLWLAD